MSEHDPVPAANAAPILKEVDLSSPDYVRFLFDRWKAETSTGGIVGSMDETYRRDFERAAGIYMAKLIKKERKEVK